MKISKKVKKMITLKSDEIFYKTRYSAWCLNLRREKIVTIRQISEFSTVHATKSLRFFIGQKANKKRNHLVVTLR